LQQTGGRPLCFAGSLLAQSDDIAEPAWARLRLALYKGAGFYVTEIRCEPAFAKRAWCRAAWHGTLAAAVREFESARPAPELPNDDATSDCAVDGLAYAMAWRAREQAQIHSWRRAVAQFLYRLCEAWTVADSDNCANI
jgi:hypothetical protein